jgi:hypothetical protein
MNWHYINSNQQLGPVSDLEIQGLIRSGQINRNTPVWNENMKDWLPAEGTQLATLFNQPPQYTPPASTSKTPRPSHKWAAITSLTSVVISVALIVAVFAMARESGIHGGKVLPARIMIVLAVLSGAGAVGSGILGIIKGHMKIAAIAGIVLGILSFLVSMLFLSASF